jgi:hypothetical protein
MLDFKSKGLDLLPQNDVVARRTKLSIATTSFVAIKRKLPIATKRLYFLSNLYMYLCVNLPVLAWKNDYFVITDYFHFPRFLLVEKIPIKLFRSTNGEGAYAAIKTSKPSVI